MCKACRGSKVGSMKNSKALSMQDIMYALGGAAISLAANGVINKAVANQSEQTKKMIGTGLPIAKVGGGTYIATKKKVSRNMRMLAVGVAAEGGLELAIKVQPQLFSIGSTGDLFLGIGNSVNYPMLDEANMQVDTPAPFLDEAILGTNAKGYAVL